MRKRNPARGDEPVSDVRIVRHRAWEWEHHYLIRSTPEALAEAIACWKTLARDARWPELSTEFRLSAHNGRSNVHLRRYRATGDLADLETSLRELRCALELLPDDPSQQAGYLHNMGIAIAYKFERLGHAALLDQAVSCFENAVVKADPESPDILQFMSSLGGALKNRFELRGDPGDLELALVLLTEALARTPVSATSRHHALVSLGLGLRTRYLNAGAPEDLDQAVRLFEEAVETTPPSGPYLPRRLDQLGAILGLRYDAEGDLNDLERSIRAFQRAIRESPPLATEVPGQWSNLGLSLRKLHERTGNPSHLDAAIQALEEAVRNTELTGPSTPWYVLNLAGGRRRRFAMSHLDEDLDRAIGLLESIRRHTTPGSALYAPAASELSLAYLQRFERGHDSEDLESALRTGREAVEVEAGDPRLPKYLSHLANVYQKAHEARGRPDDVEAAVELYRRAVRSGLVSTPETALLSGRFWGDWAARRESWAEAAEAYDDAFRALTRLLHVQGARAARETWLREIQGLTGRAAHALVRNARPARAVSVLEEGNGRLLAEVSKGRRAEIDGLEHASPELSAEFRRAQNRLAMLERRVPALESTERAGRDLGAEIRSQRAALDGTLAEIRRLEGFEHFLEAPTLEDIQATLRRSSGKTAAVYLLATLEDSLALLVTGGAIEEVWLDAGIAEIEARWTSFLDQPPDPRWPARLRERIEGNLKARLGLLPFLGERFAAPVARRLRRLAVDSVVLVPIGLLSSLPFHAASYFSQGHRRSWLDEWPLSVVPNLTSLDAAQQELRRRSGPSSLLGIGNPLPHPSPLSSAQAEVEWISRGFPASSILCGASATREAVLERLAEATHLHLACHGAFDPADPLASRLELGSQSALRLRDLILGEARPHKARLAVLSACESAVSDGRFLPDESVGLPAGFLHAGVPAVVGSLWPVDDPSTALFMHRFYRSLLGPPPQRPARALREAQLWLRDVTVSELRERFRSLRPGRVPEELSRLGSNETSRYFHLPATEKPFAHPYYWAPFVLTGAP